MDKIFKGVIYNVSPFIEEKNHIMRIIKTKGDFSSSFFSIYPYFGYNSDSIVEEISNQYEALCYGTASEEEKKINDQAHISLITKDKLSGTTILYKKVYDINGNEYGRELLTGEYFPIIPNYADYDVFYQKKKDEMVYFDNSKAKAYTLGIDTDGDCYLQDTFSSDRKLYISRRNYTYLLNEDHTSYTVSINGTTTTITLSKETVRQFGVHLVPRLKIPQDQVIEYAVANEQLATKHDIDEYQNNANKLSVKFRQRKFTKEIEKLSSLNNLGLEYYQFYINKPRKELIIEGSLLEEMQELEFLLSQLRDVSIDDYNRLNSEKEDLIDGNNKIEVSKDAIKDLQSKVKSLIICRGSNSTKIMEYLSNEINKFFESYKDNVVIPDKITIHELDEISEQLLRNRYDYSIKEQNDLLRSIAILYFFNIFYNKDKLTEEDLENSYVINNIKRIISVISVLKSEGLIKNVTSNLFEITNVSELLELIKNITFVSQEELNKEDTNELVKRIQL